MRIEHLAIWTLDIERLRHFYEKYFGAVAGEKYFNPKKNFQSYFLTFSNGCRLELMHVPELLESVKGDHHHTGLAHIAISVGDRSIVDQLTERVKADGYRVIGTPRTTGDGYYESVILDPDGNRIEITV